jgi:hypothetical protein
MSYTTNQHNTSTVIPLTPIEPNHCVLNRNGFPGIHSQHTCYPTCLLSEAQKIINKFYEYNNTLAYVIGNEVLNSREAYRAASCVKAFTSDVKKHMKQCDMRRIPLMYSAADNAISESEDIHRVDSHDGVLVTAEMNDRLKLNYLTCGQPDEQIDIFGINTYRYCQNDLNYNTSNYDKLNVAFRGSPIPVVLSEFGCAPFYYKSNEESGSVCIIICVYLASHIIHYTCCM